MQAIFFRRSPSSRLSLRHWCGHTAALRRERHGWLRVGPVRGGAVPAAETTQSYVLSMAWLMRAGIGLGLFGKATILYGEERRTDDRYQRRRGASSIWHTRPATPRTRS